jgi:leucyl-tRNA synthetase
MTHTLYEQKWAKKWAQANLGQSDPDPSKPKFFLIWAYLTVSGFHHVGHMRGFSYADFVCRFKRSCGYNVLLTAGGHASGNSAVAKAKKINEKDAQTIEYYSQMGMTPSEIQQLQTPEGFVSYFSKRYIQDYISFGFLGDWRRFTVTTNPDYNKFIEWQFLKLKEQGLLTQKPYYATWCDSFGAVAVDPSESDISKGGTAQKVEFVLIKLETAKSTPTQKEYFVVGTLRPETMFGQTNVWIHPDKTYARVKVGNQVWIVSQECAKKLPHQFEQVQFLEFIEAKKLIGTQVFAPLKNEWIPVLPSIMCDPSIGTGLVTSVPSDAPADYIALKELQDSPQLCASYGLSYQQIQSIKLIPIIQTKGFGPLPAKELCEKLHITSIKDTALLDQAKKDAYSTGFHTGIMLESAKQYAGLKVEQAKEQIKKTLIDTQLAHLFYDLSEQVISRYGDEVYIKKVPDQWFITYSDKTLTQKTKEYASVMHNLPEQFHQNLPQILDWFEDRACARQGRWLGTKLPFDQSYTIEPIADSTLYPIYYLVSKYVNLGQIQPSQLHPCVFDYVFLGKGQVSDCSAQTNIPVQLLEQIRTEVTYYYPLDYNLGGKEHQTVHFPVFLFNHAAILPAHMQPKGILINWWVTSGAGKISKSKGGAKALADEVATYSADAMRLYYANIASPFVDIAFEAEELQKYKQRIDKIAQLHEQLVQMQPTPNNKTPIIDAWLESQWNKRLKKSYGAYTSIEFKSATDEIYFGIYNDIQWYLKRGGTNTTLLHQIAKNWCCVLSIVTPFIAEELFERYNQQFASTQPFPEFDETKIDSQKEQLEQMVEQMVYDVQKIKELSKIQQPKKITIIVAQSWKTQMHNALCVAMADTRNIGELIAKLGPQFPEYKAQLAPLIQKALKTGSISVVADAQLQREAIESAKVLLEQTYGITVEIMNAQESQHPKANSAGVLKPALLLE